MEGKVPVEVGIPLLCTQLCWGGASTSSIWGHVSLAWALLQELLEVLQAFQVAVWAFPSATFPALPLVHSEKIRRWCWGCDSGWQRGRDSR